MKAMKNDAGLYEKEIDGQKYEFEKWGAEDATDALLDIAAITGKPLGAGAAAIFSKKEEEGTSILDKKIDPMMISNIMEALSERIGANKILIKALIKKLSSDKVFCEGQKINFNIHYQDRLDHLFRVVQAALEVQYGNFFSAFIGLVGNQMPKVQGIMNKGPLT